MSQIYRKILPTEAARQAYRGFFDALLENARSETPGAVLWHCTQGKDRAGLASALLLTALGADDATVRRDYSFSAEAYRDATAALLPLAQSEGLSDHETRELLGLAGNTDPEYLQMAIESIRSEYGSLRGYLERAIGLTEADLTALRDAYLTDAR